MIPAYAWYVTPLYTQIFSFVASQLQSLLVNFENFNMFQRLGMQTMFMQLFFLLISQLIVMNLG